MVKPINFPTLFVSEIDGLRLISKTNGMIRKLP